MNITVSEILKMESFENAELIAGEGGIHKKVKHINSMEIPDITPWISEGEFLITTGYSIKNNVELLEDIIRKLSELSAAGIAIKTKFIGPINKDLISLANKLNIPLILLPDNIPFVELTTPIMNLLAKKEKETRLYHKKIHDLFMGLELSGGNLNDIVTLLHKLIDLPVAILDDNYKFLASKSFNDSNYFINEVYNYFDKNNYINIDDDISYSSNILDRFLLIKKVTLKNTTCGFIIVDITNSQNDIPEVILDHAAITMALEFSRNQAIQEHSLTLDNMFFVDIMSENILSDNELILRSESLNWPKPPYVPLYFDIKDFSKFSMRFDEIELYSIKLSILNIIKRHLSTISPRTKIFLKSDNFSCIVPHNDNKNIYATIANIISETKNKYNLDLYCGIGSIIYDLNSIKNNFEDAKVAMDISRKLKLEEKYVNIEDVKLELAILKSQSIDDFGDFVMNNLKHIYDYDQVNNSNLFDTLNVYIKNGCNATNSSKELFIHRNTMNYRLNQLRDNLNLNLEDPKLIMDLSISYRINKILDIIK